MPSSLLVFGSASAPTVWGRYAALAGRSLAVLLECLLPFICPVLYFAGCTLPWKPLRALAFPPAIFR